MDLQNTFPIVVFLWYYFIFSSILYCYDNYSSYFHIFLVAKLKIFNVFLLLIILFLLYTSISLNLETLSLLSLDLYRVSVFEDAALWSTSDYVEFEYDTKKDLRQESNSYIFVCQHNVFLRCGVITMKSSFCALKMLLLFVINVKIVKMIKRFIFGIQKVRLTQPNKNVRTFLTVLKPSVQNEIHIQEMLTKREIFTFSHYCYYIFMYVLKVSFSLCNIPFYITHPPLIVSDPR